MHGLQLICGVDNSIIQRNVKGRAKFVSCEDVERLSNHWWQLQHVESRPHSFRCMAQGQQVRQLRSHLWVMLCQDSAQTPCFRVISPFDRNLKKPTTNVVVDCIDVIKSLIILFYIASCCFEKCFDGSRYPQETIFG